MGKKLFIKWLAAMAGTIFLVNCSNEQNQIQPIGGAAPTQQDELGWIVRSSAQSVNDFLSEHPEAKARTISESLDIYEITHAQRDDISSELNPSLLSKNQFVQMKSLTPETPDFLSESFATTQEALDAMSSCQRTETSPSVQLQVSQRRIELGESIRLTALTESHPEIGGDVRVIWDMISPQLSRNAIQVGIGEDQTVTPDSVGVYQVAAIAQGEDLSCEGTVAVITVTSNPELSNALQFQNAPDPSQFIHLNRIQAIEAQTKATGAGVVVAVLDSGLNYNHPGISNNLFIKESELTEESGDNDENGLPNDFMGWDFINGDNLPFDDTGHGSHVSGLIASPITGVAPGAKILPVKVMNPFGQTDVGTILSALQYVIFTGDAHIINLSLGTTEMVNPNDPGAQQLALIYNLLFDEAHKKGMLVVTASGNGDQFGRAFDISQAAVYPASVLADNQLVVTATSLGRITSYGNFSTSLVHLAAPGGSPQEPVFSLAVDNPQGVAFLPQVGTSMAAPIAAGTAALVYEVAPSLTPEQVIEALGQTGDPLDSLTQKTITGKRVNALEAVNYALEQRALLF